MREREICTYDLLDAGRKDKLVLTIEIATIFQTVFAFDISHTTGGTCGFFRYPFDEILFFCFIQISCMPFDTLLFKNQAAPSTSTAGRKRGHTKQNSNRGTRVEELTRDEVDEVKEGRHKRDNCKSTSSRSCIG